MKKILIVFILLLTILLHANAGNVVTMFKSQGAGGSGSFGNVGYSTSVTTFEGGSTSSRIYSSQHTLSQASVSVTSIVALLKATTASVNCKALIYNGTDPTTLLGTSNIVAVTTTKGSFTFNFSTPVALTSGNYWLSIVSEGTNEVSYYYEDETGTVTISADSSEYYTSPSNSPTEASTYTDEALCIYANYTY